MRGKIISLIVTGLICTGVAFPSCKIYTANSDRPDALSVQVASSNRPDAWSAQVASSNRPDAW